MSRKFYFYKVKSRDICEIFKNMLKLVFWVLMMIFMINLPISTVFYMKNIFWTKISINGHYDFAEEKCQILESCWVRRLKVTDFSSSKTEVKLCKTWTHFKRLLTPLCLSKPEMSVASIIFSSSRRNEWIKEDAATAAHCT